MGTSLKKRERKKNPNYTRRKWSTKGETNPLKGRKIAFTCHERLQDLGGGRARYFFLICEFACREAMRIARGVWGHDPPKNFF